MGSRIGDRLGELSHRHSGVLRGLVVAAAARRLLPCRQSVWRRRLRGLARAGCGRRVRAVDPQHGALDARPGCGAAGRAVHRAIHPDRLSQGARSIRHQRGRGGRTVARAAPPLWGPRRGVALRPGRLHRRVGRRGACRPIRGAGAQAQGQRRRGRPVGHAPLPEDPAQSRPGRPAPRLSLARSARRGEAAPPPQPRRDRAGGGAGADPMQPTRAVGARSLAKQAASMPNASPMSPSIRSRRRPAATARAAAARCRAISAPTTPARMAASIAMPSPTGTARSPISASTIPTRRCCVGDARAA